MVHTYQRQERRQEGKNNGGRRAKEKGIDVQRVKPLSPTQAIDALIGDVEKTGKKREQRKKPGPASNPATLDHSVAFYDPHDS